MKKVLLVLGGCLLAILIFPVLDNTSSSAVAAVPSSPSYRVYCASDDFYRHFCSINSYGGVELIVQRGGSPCIYGRTWGVTGDSIWVDRGCRADFAVRANEYSYDGDYRDIRTFYCASNDFNFHGCRVNTFGGVRLIRQRSDSPCVFGQTWGYDDRGVWVDRGCRADFAVGTRFYHRRHDRDSDDYDGNGWPR